MRSMSLGVLLAVTLLGFGLSTSVQAAPPQPRPTSSASMLHGAGQQQGIMPEGATMAPAPQAAQAMPAQASASAPAIAMTNSAGEYTLGTGDKIKVTVFNEPDLSGEFDIDSTGMLSMPLVGQIQAANMTQRQIGKAIEDRLSQGYLRDPKVSVEVMNYRPFFILGEVMKPGSYPYVNGMTVVNAVALAGGYTYRADQGDITITRATDPGKGEQKAGETGTVLPGDIVRVPERFF